MKNALKLTAILLLSLAIFSSCSKDDGLVNEPTIINKVDNFSFQVTNMVNVTKVLEYTWSNTSGVAKIWQSTNLQNGTVTLKVLDSNNTEVYSNSIDDNGSFVTDSGNPGAWKIQVTLTNYSGDIQFTVQKGN